MAKRQNNKEERLRELVGAAKAVAHPARLRMVGMLATGELCVCQMTSVLELAPSTVSQHLAVLARGGMITERKDGKLVFYRLREDGVAGRLLAPLLGGLAGDPVASSDQALVARLRKIPVATLCAADLDLVAVGIRRRSDRNPTSTPST